MATLEEMLLHMARGDPFSPLQMDELQRAGRDLDTMRAQVQNWSQPGLSDPSFGELRSRSGLFEIPPLEACFINFIGTGFAVDTDTATAIPITSSANAVIENHGTFFRLENDNLYITTPSKRVVVHAFLVFDNDSDNTFIEFEVRAFKPPSTLMTDISPSYPYPEPRVVVNPVNVASFTVILRRQFTGNDFSDGEPFLDMRVRHTSGITLNCTPIIVMYTL
jgi:hypothetical protein